MASTRPPLWVSMGASVTWCWGALGSHFPSLGLFPCLGNRKEEDSAHTHLLTQELFRGFRVTWFACLAQTQARVSTEACVCPHHPLSYHEGVTCSRCWDLAITN